MGLLVNGTVVTSHQRFPITGSFATYQHSFTQAHLDAGFESEQVDMTSRKLVFRRIRKPKPAGTATQSSGEAPFHPAYGAMQGLIRIMPGTDLTQPADPEWGELAYGSDTDKAQA